MLNVIKSFLKNNKIEYTDEMLKQLDLYYNYLIEYNKNVNLTAITDKKDVYIKHFADSLLGLEYLPKSATVCDVGTGAGFPGVVLKIFRPDIKLFLVDSLNKRIVFLNELIKLLGLKDVTTIHARVEDTLFKEKYLNKFDIVVARAVANINTLLELCLPYVKISGNFIAYKSNDIISEIDSIQNAVKLLGGNNYTVYNKVLDENTIRALIIFNKIMTTDKKFPRANNKPRLSPLK